LSNKGSNKVKCQQYSALNTRVFTISLNIDRVPLHSIWIVSRFHNTSAGGCRRTRIGGRSPLSHQT